MAAILGIIPVTYFRWRGTDLILIARKYEWKYNYRLYKSTRI